MSDLVAAGAVQARCAEIDAIRAAMSALKRRESCVRLKSPKLGPNCDPAGVWPRTQRVGKLEKSNEITGRGDRI